MTRLWCWIRRRFTDEFCPKCYYRRMRWLDREQMMLEARRAAWLRRQEK